jgi:hypothetical protein
MTSTLLTANLSVKDLQIKRNAMAMRLLAFVNDEMRAFEDETGVAVMDLSFNIGDTTSTGDTGRHARCTEVYVLLDF